VSGSLRLVRRFSGSTLEQRIVIYSDIPRIDFITHVDWHEEHKVLKAAFPAAINSPNARYEVQFGNLERPTHTSTSWDFARFEVCGHKWADLSEGDYGVSLMNDCKYGYHITENLMRLTLLRAATDPDPTADIGEHDFTYSLYPHQGDYKDGGVVRAGYELNVPLRTLVTAVHSGLLPPQLSMFALGADGVVLDTVKKAEDDDSVILRFYEAHNGRGRVTLSTQLLVKEASECDLMEREIGKLDAEQGAVRFDIAPFEIKTIKLNLE
jgi:alpha-mannosidase